MSGGTRRPLPAAKSPKSGRRMALLWPEEDSGSDRITNQLMFVPPSFSAGESSVQRLKKILFYYGLGSWFPLKPGRDMFREARCPVDACIITLDQKQTADVDAIVYHHRFAQPDHPRPPKQVRGLHLLYSRSSNESCDRVVSPILSEIGYSKFITRLRFFLIPYTSSKGMLR
jgi:glycoprotein 3-alpha-L-fucosyltransferase